MKKLIASFLLFSRKERIAIVVLLTVALSAWVLPYFITGKKMPAVSAEKEKALMQLTALLRKQDISIPAGIISDSATAPVLFLFDPNTCTYAQWLALGISEKTTSTILKYLAKGGRFNHAEDIRKIWGLKKSDADRIMPYVRIIAAPRTFYQRSSPAVPVVDINTASLEEWKALPGIGEVLARRLIQLRERSGGFVQLSEIEQAHVIPDSTFRKLSAYLRVQSTTKPKYQLNRASVYQLVTKANIDTSLARAIVAYRLSNGPYTRMDVLKQVSGMTDLAFQQLLVSYYIE